MRYLVNPMKSVRYHGKPATARARAGSGFRRNAPKRPTKRQLAARKKFAAMARARAAATRRNKRATSGGTMARRRRKAAHRRNPVRRGRARARVRRVRRYAANPRKRTRHRTRVAKRRYRRNPGISSARGIMGSITKVFVAGAGVAVGRMAFNFANNSFGASLVSATDTPTTQNVKRLGIGVGIGIGLMMLSRKVKGTAGDLLVYAAAGAVSAPLMSLLNTAMTVPVSFQPLGGTMAMPPFRRWDGSVGNGRHALPPGTTGSYPRPARAAVGMYPQVGAYPTGGFDHQPN